MTNKIKGIDQRMMILKGESPAIHKLGDIGREEDDFIDVYGEIEDKYIGSFYEGYDFIGVKFNKKDCRPLTQKEIDYKNKKYNFINKYVSHKIHIDPEGYYLLNGEKVKRIKES
jgi:hypothetical protein